MILQVSLANFYSFDKSSRGSPEKRQTISPVMIPKLIVAAKVEALNFGTVSPCIKLAQVMLAPAANPNKPLKIQITGKLGNISVGVTKTIIDRQRTKEHFLRP